MLETVELLAFMVFVAEGFPCSFGGLELEFFVVVFDVCARNVLELERKSGFELGVCF